MRNRAENQITLVMIRHGATKSNLEHRYLGRTNEPLMEEGIQKLLHDKKQGRYPKVQYVFTSPMKRCLETAELLYPGNQVIKIPEWVEMDFGAFEGKNYIDLKEDERYQTWIDSNGTLPFPEGESREQFISRSGAGFFKMCEQLLQIDDNQKTQEAYTVGIIVHGGTIMSILSSFYGGEYFDYQVSNGGGYVCTLSVSSHGLKIADIMKI